MNRKCEMNRKGNWFLFHSFRIMHKLIIKFIKLLKIQYIVCYLQFNISFIKIFEFIVFVFNKQNLHMS